MILYAETTSILSEGYVEDLSPVLIWPHFIQTFKTNSHMWKKLVTAMKPLHDSIVPSRA